MLIIEEMNKMDSDVTLFINLKIPIEDLHVTRIFLRRVKEHTTQNNVQPFIQLNLS
jgi:hypothetical protein